MLGWRRGRTWRGFFGTRWRLCRCGRGEGDVDEGGRGLGAGAGRKGRIGRIDRYVASTYGSVL